MAYTRYDDYFYMGAIEQAAATKVYKKYKITGRELNLLSGLAACLQLKNRKVIGKDLFFDWIGGNRRFTSRGWYYMKCLIEKGCLHRLAWRNLAPGREGNCLAISQYGGRILEAFAYEIEIIENKDAQRYNNPTYSKLVVNSSIIPNGYTLLQAGRDD